MELHRGRVGLRTTCSDSCQTSGHAGAICGPRTRGCAQGGGPGSALDLDRPRTRAADGARAAVVPDRRDAGRRARRRRRAARHHLLHQPGALDRMSCRLPRVQPVVRRRPRHAPRQLPARLVRAALHALPAASHGFGAAAPPAHAAAPHAADQPPDTDGRADPLALPLRRRDGAARRPGQRGGRSRRLRLRALGRRWTAGGPQRRSDPPGHSRGAGGREQRGAPAHARHVRGAGDGTGSQRHAVRPRARAGVDPVSRPARRPARRGRLGPRPRAGSRQRRHAARRGPRRPPAGARGLRRPEVPVHGGPLARGRGAGRCGRHPVGSLAHRRGRRTTGRVRARPRPDGGAQLGLGEGRRRWATPTASGSGSTRT